MYTGTLIDDLMTTVERAEKQLATGRSRKRTGTATHRRMRTSVEPNFMGVA